MNQVTDFQTLGLSDEMLEAIKEKGFETPSPIQVLTIPVLLQPGGDIIAQAQTGTGKTAAFGLPVIDLIDSSVSGVKALVLVPTRELAIQVAEEMMSFNRKKRLSIAAIYGGASMTEQLRRLSKGIDIVVGTPGRILDHIRRGTLKLGTADYLILDEADEMLNMGFIEDIEEIMGSMSEKKRTLLFSATMPSRIKSLAKRYMTDIQILKVDTTHVTPDLTTQIYFEVREGDKFDALTRIIDVEADFYGIVFSRTKVGVDDITNRLAERGYAAEGLHGDVSQALREKTLKRFKQKSVNILVATDVAARGIDVNNLTHVINYSLPQDSESYVHRIGRTGRAGNQGTAITFISNNEMRQFGYLKKDIKVDIKRGDLPTSEDIVTMKRNKILSDLQEIIEAESYSDCAEMATGILETISPEIALSALLRLAYKNELNVKNYPEIRSFSVDRKGTARIFISIGKVDGFDNRDMVELLKKECGLSDNTIDDVKVLDTYSFVTVPYTDAEKVVKTLNDSRGGSRPVAELANDKGSSRGGSRGGDRGGDRRGGGGYGGDRRGGGGYGGGDRRGGGGYGGGDRERRGGFERRDSGSSERRDSGSSFERRDSGSSERRDSGSSFERRGSSSFGRGDSRDSRSSGSSNSGYASRGRVERRPRR